MISIEVLRYAQIRKLIYIAGGILMCWGGVSISVGTFELLSGLPYSSSLIGTLICSLLTGSGAILFTAVQLVFIRITWRDGVSVVMLLQILIYIGNICLIILLLIYVIEEQNWEVSLELLPAALLIIPYTVYLGIAFRWFTLERQSGLLFDYEKSPLLNEGFAENVEKMFSEAKRTKWFIDVDKLQLLHKIGSGAFGEVWKGRYMGQEVAVKKMHESPSEESLRDFIREATLLSVLRHKNIISFIGASATKDSLILVTEFAHRGSLFDLLLRERKIAYPELSLEQRLAMGLDAARGMNYLCSLDPPVIHRDFKTPNLLVMKDYTVKVSDFGTSKWVTQKTKMTTAVGSPLWTAPEVITSGNYSLEADVYSFAVVLWELITLREPYEGLMSFQVAMKVAQEGYRMELPPENECPLEVSNLVQACWHQDPHQRPTWPEIIEVLESVSVQSSRNLESVKAD